jgi:hypothetical protein
MDSNQINKLISIFLGLSIIVGSFIFAFSDYFTNSYNNLNKNETKPENNLKNQNSNNNLSGSTSFVESPKDLYSYYSTISLESDEFNPSGNLTEDFANFAAKQIVLSNPSGPQTDEDGNPSINAPDLENLSDQFASKVLDNLKIPEWQNEINDVIAKIKTTPESSTSTLIAYFTKVQELLPKYFDSQKINDLFNSGLGADVVADTGAQFFDEGINEFLKIETPQDLKNFNQSIIKLLVYNKKIFEEGKKVNTDPLYFNLVLANKEKELDQAVFDVEKNFNLVSQKYSYLNKYNYQNNITFFDKVLENTILAPKTYAAWPVIDWAAIGHMIKKAAQETYRYLKENWKKMALEILKDQLIHRLVQETIKWVQGGGKPQFITDWKKFFGESGSRAVGEITRNVLPFMCQPYQPLLRVVFENISPSPDKYARCTLGDIERNLTQFYDSFKNGSWIAYGSILRPENDFYGQILILNDLLLEKSGKEKEADKSEAEAGKGFFPKRKCIKATPLEEGVPQKLVPEILSAMQSQGKYMGNIETWCDKPDEKNPQKPILCDIMFCEKYENNTPGALMGDIVGNAVGNSPIARIVNAQDMAALVSALVNSALMKLIKSAQGLLSSALTGGGSGSGGSAGGAPGSSQGLVTDPCYGYTPGTQEYDECLNTTSGNGLYGIDSTEQRSDLIQSARNILSLMQNSIKDNNNWLELASSTKIKLDQIGGCSNQGVGICPNLSNDACALLNDINTAENSIKNEIDTLNLSISNIQNIINELYNDSNISMSRLNEITNLISRYNDPALNNSSERLANLQNIDDAANKNINEFPTCQVPLPSL